MLNVFSPRRIIIPILIGLGVVFYYLYDKFDPSVFKQIEFSPKLIFWIFVALVLMVFRDIGYIIRLRILSDYKLTFKQSFRIIMLWEFTSAVTPSSIGGTSVALLFINKEGISVGRSSAIVMATSFLDELYFIITFPFLLLFIKSSKLFAANTSAEGMTFANEFFYFAIIGYGLKLVFTLFISYGLFINPKGLRWLLMWVFKLPLLRRWRNGANEAGKDIVLSSKELKKKSAKFWIKAFLATAFSWTSRYWVVNAIFMAFFIIPDHFLLYARQLVAWIMMLVSPTPGGSGFSEIVFVEYFGDLIPIAQELKESFATMLALLWRFISYYPYLIIGAIVFPKWISQKFTKPAIKK